jgi:hypothetical protein
MRMAASSCLTLGSLALQPLYVVGDIERPNLADPEPAAMALALSLGFPIERRKLWGQKLGTQISGEVEK